MRPIATRPRKKILTFFLQMFCSIKNNPHICIIKQGQKVSKTKKRGVSSAGSEHLPYKQGVTGSNPVRPTKGQLQSCPFFMSILFYSSYNLLKIPRLAISYTTQTFKVRAIVLCTTS